MQWSDSTDSDELLPPSPPSCADSAPKTHSDCSHLGADSSPRVGSPAPELYPALSAVSYLSG